MILNVLNVLMLHSVFILIQNIFQLAMIILEHGLHFSHNDLEWHNVTGKTTGNGPFNITLSSIAFYK